jgi:hypothetical protein
MEGIWEKKVERQWKIIVKTNNKSDKKSSQFVTLNEAQKTPNVKCSSRRINDKSIAVTIPKKEVENPKDFLPTLNIALMFGLRQVGIDDIDVTFQEHKAKYVLVVET